MKTCLDCIPCFMRQALEASRLVTKDEVKIKQVLDSVARAIPEFPLDTTPPEMAGIIFRAAKTIANHSDPYKPVKDLYNKKALQLYPALQKNFKRLKILFSWQYGWLLSVILLISAPITECLILKKTYMLEKSSPSLCAIIQH